jgi:hypothetical protein
VSVEIPLELVLDAATRKFGGQEPIGLLHADRAGPAAGICAVAMRVETMVGQNALP